MIRHVYRVGWVAESRGARGTVTVQSAAPLAEREIMRAARKDIARRLDLRARDAAVPVQLQLLNDS